MSRSSLLQPEHVAVLRSLREANPGIGMGRLRFLVAAACGLVVVPSHSALHRFMVKHGVLRGAYLDRPTRNSVENLAGLAHQIALEKQEAQAALSAWRAPGWERAEFVANVAAAFHALMFVSAHSVGVPGIDSIADRARDWLAASGSAEGSRFVLSVQLNAPERIDGKADGTGLDASERPDAPGGGWACI